MSKDELAGNHQAIAKEAAQEEEKDPNNESKNIIALIILQNTFLNWTLRI